MNEPINNVIPAYVATLNAYQLAATRSAIYPGRGTFAGLVYTSLKLNGEAGEIAEKVGKVMRDEGSKLSSAKIIELAKELGDVLWYVSAQANELGYTLEQIANINIEKLASRTARGKLSGSGDNR